MIRIRKAELFMVSDSQRKTALAGHLSAKKQEECGVGGN